MDWTEAIAVWRIKICRVKAQDAYAFYDEVHLGFVSVDLGLAKSEVQHCAAFGVLCGDVDKVRIFQKGFNGFKLAFLTGLEEFKCCFGSGLVSWLALLTVAG